VDGRFEAFGTSHWVMLVVFAAGLWPMARLGRAHRSDPDRRASRSFAVVLVAFLLPLQVIDHLPGRFDLDTSLPFQLCDLAAVAAVIALWSHHPTAVAATYFWGIVLTPQALLTPALVSDFPHPRFLAFWGMHILVIWAAVFLVWGLRLRPTWRTLGQVVAITASWMVVMYFVNVALGTNYGFVNEKPPTGSVLDLLGPWPVYLVAEVVIVGLVWCLMTLPWTRQRPAVP
jgi:hypothetical integral membrane protein (TIGR02206 family)